MSQVPEDRRGAFRAGPGVQVRPGRVEADAAENPQIESHSGYNSGRAACYPQVGRLAGDVPRVESAAYLQVSPRGPPSAGDDDGTAPELGPQNLEPPGELGKGGQDGGGNRRTWPKPYQEFRELEMSRKAHPGLQRAPLGIHVNRLDFLAAGKRPDGVSDRQIDVQLLAAGEVDDRAVLKEHAAHARLFGLAVDAAGEALEVRQPGVDPGLGDVVQQGPAVDGNEDEVSVRVVLQVLDPVHVRDLHLDEPGERGGVGGPEPTVSLESRPGVGKLRGVCGLRHVDPFL